MTLQQNGSPQVVTPGAQAPQQVGQPAPMIPWIEYYRPNGPVGLIFDILAVLRRNS